MFQYLAQRKQRDDDAAADDEPSIDIMAAQFAQPHLIESSEKDIRLYVACCLSDIFRIYAPNIPYDDDQLQVSY